ncbi:MAG: hypothetical protein ACRDS0_10830 [Pseudonocardiaceae bacterium]
MDTRHDAHRLLDELDEDQVATATELLRDLVRQRRPLDDEQEVVIQGLQEYLQHPKGERQRAAAIEDGLALLLSGDLDHPDRDSAWH